MVSLISEAMAASRLQRILMNSQMPMQLVPNGAAVYMRQFSQQIIKISPLVPILFSEVEGMEVFLPQLEVCADKGCYRSKRGDALYQCVAGRTPLLEICG